MNRFLRLTLILCLTGIFINLNARVEAPRRATVSTGSAGGYEYVDLGLSVLWATKNVGASTESDLGKMFAWGETQTKSSFTQGNSTMYRHDVFNDSRFYIEGGSYNLPSSLDAASYNWGSDWRMPTIRELRELMNYCIFTKEEINGKAGYRVTGPNGNSIFFPGNLANGASYWTASTGSDIEDAFGYQINSPYHGGYFEWVDSRADGGYVRGVTQRVRVEKITIEGPTSPLEIDDTYQLKYTISPSNATNREVKWSTSDNNIAKVSDTGLVTATGSGKAVITCTAQDGWGGSGSYTIEVAESPKPTRIFVSPTTMSLTVGQSDFLTYSLVPSNARAEVKWVSANEDIASVINGRVIGKGPGSTFISAVTDNGQESSCLVTVKLPEYNRGETFTASVKNLKGNERMTLTFEVVNASRKLLAVGYSNGNGAYDKNFKPTEDDWYIEIPEKFEDYTVMEISEGAFADCKYLYAIKLPQTISTINRNSFANTDLVFLELQSDTPPELSEEVFGNGPLSWEERHLCVPKTGIDNYLKKPWINFDVHSNVTPLQFDESFINLIHYFEIGEPMTFKNTNYIMSLLSIPGVSEGFTYRNNFFFCENPGTSIANCLDFSGNNYRVMLRTAPVSWSGTYHFKGEVEAYNSATQSWAPEFDITIKRNGFYYEMLNFEGQEDRFYNKVINQGYGLIVSNNYIKENLSKYIVHYRTSVGDNGLDSDDYIYLIYDQENDCLVMSDFYVKGTEVPNGNYFLETNLDKWDGWIEAKYTNVISTDLPKPMENNSVAQIEIEEGLAEIYTLQGIKVYDNFENLGPGVYIIRTSEGTKKIIKN